MAMPPQDLHPELALLSRMKRGDEEAFVQLYRRHRDPVYRLALLYSGSAAHAADVTQEVFVHFMTHTAQYDPVRGTLGAWLCGVARNMARKAVGGREDATDPDLLCDDSGLHEEHIDRDTPLERLLRGEVAEGVRRAVAALAPHYRDVLILCELSELSYAEAAQLCGIDIGTVRSRLSRARAARATPGAPQDGRQGGRTMKSTDSLLEPGQDTLLDLKLDALRGELGALAAPPGLEAVLAARFRDTRSTARPRLWWMPPLALAATVALVSWVIRGPTPDHSLAALPPAAEADAGPFLALRPLERIALEPGTTMVTTEFPRALLADWGLPVSPDRAGEPVRAEMLYSADGEPLAVRLLN